MSQVEYKSRIIESGDINLYHDEYDVIVFGFGGAGISAAKN